MLQWTLKIIEPFQDQLDKNISLKRAFQALYEKLSPNEWVLTNIQGCKIYVNTRDRHIGRFALQKGVYEVGTTKVFKDVVKRGMTVVDVGSGRGYFSLIAARLVGSEGRVFAFEPEPSNYGWLVKYITINGFKNILPIKKAVSDKKGTTKLHLDRVDIGRHSIVFEEGRDDYVKVETISLDDFFEENQILPDVVKMDIEGAEVLALKGMRRTIERSANLRMFIEYERNKEEVYDFLAKYFEIYRITNDGKLIQAKDDKDFFEPNIYCVRK